MNTLLKKHYSDPQVNIEIIMNNILPYIHEHKQAKDWKYLFILIPVVILSIVFIQYFIDFNLHFSELAISNLFSYNPIILVLGSILVTILTFIIKFYPLLLLSTILVYIVNIPMSQVKV